MATASEAKLGYWRDYSRRYIDREQLFICTCGNDRTRKLTSDVEACRAADTRYRVLVSMDDGFCRRVSDPYKSLRIQDSQELCSLA